jgi:N-ethylmaleimide reductase
MFKREIMTTLFDPITFGRISAANRVVMAPLTRNRADSDRAPTRLMATYYQQRASAGLIVSEATQISPSGQGYFGTPGIYSIAQIIGWSAVTEAVHSYGGKIVAQLWHVGRISHVSLQPGGALPVSSTSRRAVAKTFTARGFEDVSAPRALSLSELPGIVDDYRQAALNAIEAGFDGIEVHGANGYLLDQFLRDSINDRTDRYGGSIENRVRLPVEILSAIASAIGGGRTGLRISPVSPVNDAGQDSEPQALFGYLLGQLAHLRLAFIHVIEGTTGGARDSVAFDCGALRDRFKSNNPMGAWIVNNGYTRDMSLTAIASGSADMVAFGRLFIGNPDLVRRLLFDSPMNVMDPETLYGGGAHGYTDYPTWESPAGTDQKTPTLLTIEPGTALKVAKPVWFVTGCSSGFGRELARQLLEAGYRTVITARDTGKIGALAALGDALVLKLDVTDPNETTAAIDAAQRHFGGIDVLVNNAGVGYFAAVEEGEEAQVRRLFDINFFGLTRLIQAVLPGMRERRSGFIVNLSSIGGLKSFPAVGFYNATKFAVEGLSEALWQEVGPMGIHVMLVEPSGFRTDWAGRKQIRASSGKQAGDPVLAARSIINAVRSAHPPHRLLLGAAAYEGAMAKLDEMRDEFTEWGSVARAADHAANGTASVLATR